MERTTTADEISSQSNAEALTTEVVEVGTLEAIERAQIDMQISTAKRYPRDIKKVKNMMLSIATLDEETASSCFYTLPRGGKSIQGPSVRLAEIALSAYGNLRTGTRILNEATAGANPHVIIQAVAHDLENNVAVSIEKRRRVTKKKSKTAIDDDDINLAVNSCSSIALRDAMFRVIPKALILPVYEAAKKVAVGDVKSLAVKRGKVIDRLKQMGLTEERILAAIGCEKMDDVDADKLATLIGLGTALKDGETTLEEAFPPLATKVKSPKRDEITNALVNAHANVMSAIASGAKAASDINAESLAAQAAAEALASDDQIPGAEVPAQPEQPNVQATQSVPDGELPDLDNPAQWLLDQCKKEGITEAQLMKWCLSNKLSKPTQESLIELADYKLKQVATNWPTIVTQVKQS